MFFSGEFYEIINKEMILILYNFFQNIEAER
jgi:hypothetical protein